MTRELNPLALRSHPLGSGSLLLLQTRGGGLALRVELLLEVGTGLCELLIDLGLLFTEQRLELGNLGGPPLFDCLRLTDRRIQPSDLGLLFGKPGAAQLELAVEVAELALQRGHGVVACRGELLQFTGGAFELGLQLGDLRLERAVLCLRCLQLTVRGVEHALDLCHLLLAGGADIVDLALQDIDLPFRPFGGAARRAEITLERGTLVGGDGQRIGGLLQACTQRITIACHRIELVLQARTRRPGEHQGENGQCAQQELHLI